MVVLRHIMRDARKYVSTHKNRPSNTSCFTAFEADINRSRALEHDYVHATVGFRVITRAGAFRYSLVSHGAPV